MQRKKRVTAILCQLSAALSTGRPLPRRMEMPKAYQLSENLRKLDPNVLRVKHIQEAGYSAFAVMEIISHMIIHNLDTLVLQVESLVGVINFSNLDTNYKSKTK